MNFRSFFAKVFPLLIQLAVLLTCPAVVMAGESAVFKDVVPDGAYKPYIMFLFEKGVIKGYPDGTFGPEKSLTRAEAVTALSILSNISPPEAANLVFKDVPAGHWAAWYIGAGAKSGIINGYPDGTFKPESMVTRAELAALLVKLSEMEISPSPVGIADVPPEHWARGVIDTAVKNGFFLYSPGIGKFNPESPASREVFARGAALAVTGSPKLSAVIITGQASLVSGEVRVVRSGIEMKLGTATSILPGDIIRTGNEGEAKMDFDDGTGLLIKPGTSLTFNKMKGRLAVKSDGMPVSITDELELKLDNGKIVGICLNRMGQETGKTAYLDKKPVLIASSVSIPRIIADAAGAGTLGRGTVRVVMPWGTATSSGLFTNEVTPSGQSTTVLLGQATVLANGNRVTVNPGQASTIGSPSSSPEAPRSMTVNESGVWILNQQWVTTQAGRIDRARLVGVNGAQGSSQAGGGAQPRVGLLETVTKLITSLSEKQGSTVTKPPAGGGGGVPGQGQNQNQDRVPSITYSMDYSTKDLTPTDNNPAADGYQVDIYLNSMANATYIEYTFEYDNTKLASVGVYPDLSGILTAFTGHQNLSLADLAIDSGWISNSGRTCRTIRTNQLDIADPLNYSGGRVRLLYLNFKKIGAGSATVSIKNIRVSYGSRDESMPDVTLTIP